MTEGSGAGLNMLLEFVRDSRGFDFTGYKRASIERRVSKRMAEVGVPNEHYDEYVEYLEVHSEEFSELFNTLLISVTGFFRDPSIWAQLENAVVPALLADRHDGSQIRVWCAGCASGEEPYTVAMVLARVMGDAAFCDRVKIYATDVDEEALDQARRGAYLPRQIEDIPRDALERFFEQTGQRHVFRRDLRRCVIFGRNDLLQDAPISRIDLLVCRNTLGYFTAEMQSQILRRFHFALNKEGVLMLGKSEMLVTQRDLFTPADPKWRVFAKVVRPARHGRGGVIAADRVNGPSQNPTEHLRESAFDAVGPASVVLDASGSLVMANEEARRTFGLTLADFGRPIQDLELSYRPVELRSLLDAVAVKRRTTEIKAIPWRRQDQERVFDIRIAPLMGNGTPLGAAVSYIDVTESHRLAQQVSTSREELEQAYEELHSTLEEFETTNEELQSTVEELRSTNEELQSTNEELETTNAELQSTNAELQSTDDELQSTNHDLETMHDELRRRTRELNQVNAFLQAVVTTMGLAVVVLDHKQRVQIWNDQAHQLWGPSSNQVQDQHVLSLDIGLPLDQVMRPIRACLNDGTSREEVVVAALDRRGVVFDCKVTILRLGLRREDSATGVILTMEPMDLDGAARD